jgi:hypothetical protein
MLLFLLPIVFPQHVADLVDRLYIHSIVYSIIENERANHLFYFDSRWMIEHIPDVRKQQQ